MARKKKIEVFNGLNNVPENKLIVQKSRPLAALWTSDLTLAEFKIMDTYLARINTRQPEKRTVILEKGEIEKCLCVKRIRQDELTQRIIHLGQGIKISDPNTQNGFKLIWLFEEAQCKQDENGLWQITLECSKKAMDYFFKVEDFGYFRYKLRCVAGLNSRYSYVLFMYLETNRFRKTWKVSVSDLKNELNANEEIYHEYKFFNQKILKRCKNEIEENTECRFTYEPIKKGRKVSEIRFTLETVSDTEIESDDEQLKLQSEKISKIDDKLELIAEACNHEFSQIQCEEIFQNICNLPIPEDEYGIDTARFHYVAKLYSRLNCAAERAADNGKPIKDRYKYFIALIKNNKI